MQTLYYFGLFNHFIGTVVFYLVLINTCNTHSSLPNADAQQISLSVQSFQALFDLRLLLCIFLLGNIYLLWLKSKIAKQTVFWKFVRENVLRLILGLHLAITFHDLFIATFKTWLLLNIRF